ncbi:Fe2OG dioxygenase domain-containing protein [Balamuthia mandrillaris]
MSATRTTTASSQQQTRAPHLDELPAEVQRLVVNSLELQDKLRLRQASRRWLALVHSSSPALRRSIRVAALKGASRALRQDSLFCCGGATELSHPLRVSFQKSVAPTTTNEGEGEKLVSGFLSFPLMNPEGTRRGSVEELEGEALAGLIKCCSAATFGKGSKEVLDPSYRRALQLSPHYFLTNFVPSENDILDKIKRILAPNSWKVRAELYKLNVYPEGGHFKAHVDTPRGDGMFGSLVVCLPTCFQGGELVVRQAPSEVVFDLASTTMGSAAGEQLVGDDGGREAKQTQQLSEPECEAKRPQPKEAHHERCSVKWAAFYADCEHEILPVTAGHRITLTYNLYSERAQHLEEHKKDDEEKEKEKEKKEKEAYKKEEEKKDEEEEAQKKYKTTAEKKVEPKSPREPECKQPQRRRAKKIVEPKNPREPECKQHETTAEKKVEPKSPREPECKKRSMDEEEKEEAGFRAKKAQMPKSKARKTEGEFPQASRTSGSPSTVPTKRVLDMDMVRKHLAAILADPDCFPEGVTLAFHCQHSYSTEQFSQAPTLSALLKGFDALVQEAATSLGLETSLRCFFALDLCSSVPSELSPKALLVFERFPRKIEITNECVGEGEYDNELEYICAKFKPKLLVEAFPPLDPLLQQRAREAELIKRLIGSRWMNTERQARRQAQEIVEEEGREREKLERDLPKQPVQWCTDKPQLAKDLVVAVTAAYGNEPSTECFYASAMLFVEIPPPSFPTAGET